MYCIKGAVWLARNVPFGPRGEAECAALAWVRGISSFQLSYPADGASGTCYACKDASKDAWPSQNPHDVVFIGLSEKHTSTNCKGPNQFLPSPSSDDGSIVWGPTGIAECRRLARAKGLTIFQVSFGAGGGAMGGACYGCPNKKTKKSDNPNDITFLPTKEQVTLDMRALEEGRNPFLGA